MLGADHTGVLNLTEPEVHQFRESARVLLATRVVPEVVRARIRNQTRETRAEASYDDDYVDDVDAAADDDDDHDDDVITLLLHARNLTYEADDEASENEDTANGSDVIERGTPERGRQTNRTRTKFARRH
ncbi:hypothetical protein DPMN_061311 [Dreissena polymorpha]|uniref:Uncharacterized protein n=1 Tax=Dreissena polymorpha TaxID=45954 RepID=A0A9D4HJ22_DREPO|nr:hypothetical protein DPMN_061311 [Dreissena polymorpha]